MPAPDDAFAIMYTSGTTGPPKGAIVSHRMLRLAGESVRWVSAAQNGDVFYMWEPLYHIGGAQLLVLPLLRRVMLAMVPRFRASRFWAEVRELGATHIHFLGGILQILLKQPPSAADREHRVRIAWGGGCPTHVWRPFEERFGVRDSRVLRHDRSLQHHDVERRRGGRLGRAPGAVVQRGTARS